MYEMKAAHGRVAVRAIDYGAGNAGIPKAFITRDDKEMAYMGKKQQLKRNFGLMSMLGFSCTLMITWEGLFGAFVYGLQDGGPAGLVYGFLLCWLGYFAVVASMAEMVSLAPTAGGQYHWAFLFAPRSCRKFISYITGWQSILAWQACLASAAFLGGTLIQGLLVLNYPNYVFRAWHGSLLISAVTLFAFFFNTYLAAQLPKVEGAVLILHIVGFFGILITLTYLAPHGTPKDVFATYLTLGGYSPGVSFFVGLITTVFAFLGADGAVHMCEEIKNASTIVPYSLLASIAINGTLGFAMLIAVLFCIGNIKDALNSPTGFPVIYIFQNATKSNGGTSAMTAVVLTLCIFSSIASLAAASRIIWAFARDNGVPGSYYLSQVEPRTKLPLYAIGLSALITILLSMINIGSAAAFNAVASILVSGFLGSYILPLFFMLYNRIRDPGSINYGPFTLGRFGIFTNIFALCWTVLVMIFSFFPAAIPVTLATMNWSCLLWGSTMIFGLVFYIVYQRGRYTGPVVETAILEHVSR